MIRKDAFRRYGAAIAIIAVLAVLLGWGLIALGWTQLTTTNDARVAIETAKRPIFSDEYSLPLDSEQTYATNVKFEGICDLELGFPTCPVVMPPISNSSTTVEDYVTFDLSIPNGTAIRIWYMGPQGNMTVACGSRALSVECHIEPNFPGTLASPLSYYFPVRTPGRYSIHILSEQCMTTLPPPYTSNCSANTATGSVNIGLSTIQYSRPYWAWGFATEIAAIIGIITTLIVAGVTAYRGQKRRIATYLAGKGANSAQGPGR